VLYLTTDRSDPEMFVTLARISGDTPSTIPVALQRQIWARWARSSDPERSEGEGSGVRARRELPELIAPPAPQIPRSTLGMTAQAKLTTLAWEFPCRRANMRFMPSIPILCISYCLPLQHESAARARR
jgi:hypothetical protein